MKAADLIRNLARIVRPYRATHGGPRGTKQTGHILSTTILACFLFVGVTCSQSSQTNGDDLIHFGDLIDVDVVGGFDFDWRGTLTPEGFLDGANSYGDPIFALCRSESEVAADLKKAFSKFLKNPEVIVRLIDRSNRAVVTLDGAVRYPQRFQLHRVTHLRELIVLSGGLTDDASGEIQIFRPKSLTCAGRGSIPASPSDNDTRDGNDAQTMVISVSDLLKGTGAADPAIQSGDLITVRRAVPIYVIGGVNNPRPIYARAKMKLTQAIAIAGGMAKDADGGHVTVFRRVGTDTSIFDVDLNKINADGPGDLELKAYDIVEIGQKGRPARKTPPIVGNISSGRIGVLPLRIVE